MDTRKDFVTETVCCGVGHAGDLIYTFGINSMWDAPWESPVSDYIIEQVNIFSHKFRDFFLPCYLDEHSGILSFLSTSTYQQNKYQLASLKLPFSFHPLLTLEAQ